MSQHSKTRTSPSALPRNPPDADPGASSSQPNVQSRRTWFLLAISTLLVCLVWAVFGQTRDFKFIDYDDNEYVYENSAVTNGLNSTSLAWAFTHSVSANWHPLTMLTHMTDCQLYGLNAGRHHLTNVLLHAVVAVSLFLTLQSMTGALWRSAFVAAVFAIHPLRVESVAWISERKDVLSGLFFVLTVWAYTRYARGGLKTGRDAPGVAGVRPLLSGFYWLALVFFALGLMSKPMLVTLPFVLLLLDYWPLQRFGLSEARTALARLSLEKLPFLLLGAASCVATLWAQRNAIEMTKNLEMRDRLANALVTYVTYLKQMVYPVGLAVFYPHPATGLPLALAGFCLLVLLALTVVTVVAARKHRWLPVGWFWYLGMLVPVIGLVQVGAQARAVRYTYLPQIGIYLIVAWAAVELIPAWRYRRLGLAAGGVIIVGLLAALARVQTECWKDSLTVWTNALNCTSDNYIAHYSLGWHLAELGKVEEAIQHYQQTIEILPDDAQAHNNLGILLTGQGKFEEAVQEYECVLRIDPDHAEAHNNLGNLLAGRGKVDQAIEHFEHALRTRPDYSEARNNLGVALSNQGKLDEAIQQYKRALQLDPAYADAHLNLGVAMAARGDWAHAVECYERTLRLKPNYAKAHFNLGAALVHQQKVAEAVSHFEQAIRFQPDYLKAYFSLGDTLAKQGKPSEAAPYFQQALSLATAQNNPSAALTIRLRLAECTSAAQPQTP